MMVHASIISMVRLVASDPTSYLVEYAYLSGPLRSGHIQIAAEEFSTEEKLILILKQGLVDFLNAEPTGDRALTIADVVLLG